MALDGIVPQVRKTSTADAPPDPPAAGGLSATDARRFEVYRVFRAQIEHQDNLLGSRTSVFVTSQSFLFSAYAIIANNAAPRAFLQPVDPKRVLLVLIPLVAITTSALFIPAIASGVLAMRRLRRQYRQLTGHPPDECCDLLPPIQSERRNRIGGSLPSALLPPLFMSVWTYLLLAKLF